MKLIKLLALPCHLGSDLYLDFQKAIGWLQIHLLILATPIERCYQPTMCTPLSSQVDTLAIGLIALTVISIKDAQEHSLIRQQTRHLNWEAVHCLEPDPLHCGSV